MQSRFLLEGYLKTANWLEANEWLQEECCLLHAKLKRKRIVYNIFGILMALVTAFFNWVILFGMGDEEELIAFPLTTLCHNLFLLLCEKIPGGKAVVIIGLLLLPFVVALVLWLLLLGVKSRKYREREHSDSAADVLQKLDVLAKLDDKYTMAEGNVLAYFVLAVVLTGVVMVITSVPAGFNPFEYLIVGAICGVAHFLIFAGCSLVFSWLADIKKVPSYPTYDWRKYPDNVIVKPAKSEPYCSYSRLGESEYYKSKFDEYYAQYTGTPYETDAEWAARIVRSTEEDLSGKGYGDY